MNRTLLSLVLAFFACGTAAGDEPRRVRIVTWNLLHARERNDARLDLVARTLERERPDVVGLQEVSRSALLGRRNRARALGDMLGMQWVYRASDGIPLLWEEGLAILSRGPIARTARRKLVHSYPMPFEGRQVLMAEVRLADGSPFCLFSTHLAHKREREVENLEQALEVAEVVAREALARGIPAVLVGDLNAETPHLAMRALTGDLLGEAPFEDAWARVGTGPGITADARNPLSSDPDGPSERIDYVLVLRGTGVDVRPVAARLLGDAPTDGLYASDHFGIAVDLELRASEGAAASPPSDGIDGIVDVLGPEPAAGRASPEATAGTAAAPAARDATPAARAADLLARIAALRERIEAIRDATRRELERENGDSGEDGRRVPPSNAELRARVLARLRAALE